MKQKTISLAKIAIPKVYNIFLRKRLFSLINSYPERPITWVTAPAGSGKTTLITSFITTNKIPCLWYQVDEGDNEIASFFYYMSEAVKENNPEQKSLPLLSPEYLPNLNIFTKKYFEDLYDGISRNNKKFTLVFDNYQDVTHDSTFHNMINIGLSLLPEGINVVFISRSEPPSVFARLLANEKINYIGWNELKFDIDEFKKIISDRGIKNITLEIIKQLHLKTDGWIAGLILLLENEKIKNTNFQFLDKLTHQEIFNYFMNEVFNKADEKLHDFLLKTSFLPKFTVSIAEKITNDKSTNKILSFLYRNHYFTEKQNHIDPFYWYHPLFREFLLSRTKYFFTEDDIVKLKKKAALLLEEAGQVEYAARLYESVQDFDGLINIILKHAMTFILQGRGKLVENWINTIPMESVEHNPWLLYLSGICRQAFNPNESILLLEKAFKIFKAQNDKIGLFLSWVNIVDTITLRLGDMYLLDDCINSIKDFLYIDESLPSFEIDLQVSTCMFACLFYRHPEHPDLNKWMHRALILSEKKLNKEFQILTIIYVSIYLLCIGDFLHFEIILNKSKKLIKNNNLPPFALLRLKLNEAYYFSLVGSMDNCLLAISDGLKISQDTGLHLLDHQFFCYGAFISISCSDFQKVEEFIEKMNLLVDEIGTFEKAIHYFVLAWYSLVQGNTSRALFHQEIALKMSQESGFIFSLAISYFNMAQIFFIMDKHKESLEYLSKCSQLNIKIKSNLIEYMCLLFEAYFIYNKNGIDSKTLKSIQKAFAFGKQKEYYNFLGFIPNIVTELCVKALDAGIEVEYVETLIKKRNLTPNLPPQDISNWPWDLKIYTLGKFKLEKNGKLLQFSGKIQQKPLEMLKVLINFGAKDVSTSLLVNTLWGEADGDMANISFKTTLHRLRKLLNNSEMIQLNGGKLSLNDKYCWVDIWGLEDTFKKIDVFLSQNEHPEKYAFLIDKIFSLYNGHFLVNEEDAAYSFSLHEKLKNKFTNCIIKFSNNLEQKNEYSKSIEYCKKGIEIDDTIEEFYQNLMLCYYKLGKQGDAIKIYSQLKNVLSNKLNIFPSEKTEEIYRLLRNK